ncbi:hypothetical protein LZ31DRAFT_187600 [Colletotrichum somersetense]|nr:hypothetical protein LZ31DRAFT_187600 [Colletotrichum somersetense]
MSHQTVTRLPTSGHDNKADRFPCQLGPSNISYQRTHGIICNISAAPSTVLPPSPNCGCSSELNEPLYPYLYPHLTNTVSIEHNALITHQRLHPSTPSRGLRAASSCLQDAYPAEVSATVDIEAARLVAVALRVAGVGRLVCVLVTAAQVAYVIVVFDIAAIALDAPVDAHVFFI